MDEGLGSASKMQSPMILASAVIGVALGQIQFFRDSLGSLMEPFLMVLLFLIFLKVDVRQIGRSFRNVKFTSTELAINFIWTPFFAVGLGLIFLGDSLPMRIGFLMLLATPCTDWYLVFTAMTKGNVPLSTAILPLNLVLQLVLLPVYLFLMVGSDSQFEMLPLLEGIVYVLVIPFALANIIRIVLVRASAKDRLDRFLDARGDELQLRFLCLAVVAMFASQGQMIVENLMLPVRMLLPLAAFFVFNFVLAQAIGRFLRLPFDDAVSLSFTTLARNSPLALAIAVAAFPDEPLIALVLVVGPLIELPVLSVVSRVLHHMRTSQESRNDIAV
ncbi:MAG: arsenic resistance protein [Candidatus Methanoplasma sp.]|jgi:ACR3 family arsenite efflux pump ArsB|nr:arsenic resistance protein [Candidatus Methanoplasma sp.]